MDMSRTNRRELDETTKFQRYGILKPEEENKAGRIFGHYGVNYPVGGMGGIY
jgi:hypothetical protein